MNSETQILEIPSPSANASPAPRGPQSENRTSLDGQLTRGGVGNALGRGEGELPTQHPATSIQNPPRPDDPSTQPNNPSIQQSTDPDPVHPAVGKGHRGNGFVARRPKVVRDQINNMILDGISYPDIIARLGEAGQGLKPDHIHQWKKHGYQTWLIEREWLEKISSKTEFSSDILATPDSSGLHEAGLRIAASQMFDQLMLFDAANQASDGSTNHAEKFARLVNALSRLTREALSFQKYRDTTAAKLAQLDPDRELADHVHDRWADRIDGLFMRPRRRSASASSSALAAPTCRADLSRQSVLAAAEVGRRRKLDVGESLPHSQPSTPALSSDSASTESTRRGNETPSSTAASAAEDVFKVQSSKFDVQSSPPSGPTLDFRPKTLDSPSPSPAAPKSHEGGSPVTRHPSRTRDLCHECRAPLPPLLPTGERPSTHCRKCGAGLRPPGALIEFCPKCRRPLPELTLTGARPSPRCPQCQCLLPPPPNLESVSASSSSSSNSALHAAPKRSEGEPAAPLSDAGGSHISTAA